jgi:hypothetical protein
LSGYANLAGKRLVLPPYLFRSQQVDVFNGTERKYPVYFSYAFGESDTVAIAVPDGYTVESIPAQLSNSLPYATYLNAVEFESQRLTSHRVLQVSGIFFQVEVYPELKEFFRTVKTGDGQNIVFE